MMENNVMELFSDVNTMWVLVGAALVFFMQAGFAMVETGFTRSKNAGNIIMKNLMDFSIGTALYWLVGFGIMFGVQSSVFGGIDFFTRGDYSLILPKGVTSYSYFIFQTVFCATAATIVSGAMAERTKFSSYCIYSALISLLVYPVSGHWIWGGGWLAELGFHDFAGSTAVHMVGGAAAFVGAYILGPRMGKYDKDGKVNAIPGHSIPLGALGVFILWFCWFGFNGGSTLSMTEGNGAVAGKIFFNTNLAASMSTLVVMFVTWIRYKKPDVSMTLNGSLAGLVAITAGCDVVNPWAAAVIGILAGFAVVFGIEFVDQVLKVDDPVGAVGVHFVNGALGTVLTGVLISEEALASMNMERGSFLLVQILGVAAVLAWVTITMTILFTVIKKTVGLRVTPQEEIMGLDMPEHGLASAYGDFVQLSDPGMAGVGMSGAEIFQAGMSGSEILQAGIADSAAAPYAPSGDRVPPENVTAGYPADLGTSREVFAHKITKIDILFKQEKFEDLKNAMREIGITGMTVTHVLGCGVQKGKPEYYRGVRQEIDLLPKVQMEIVVSKVPVKTVVETAKRVLHTGHIGDGKIFVYDVENVIKVRTGEEGIPALQGVE